MNTLIVIVGPTGVGKTEFSLSLAETFKCPILSADSRQIYREIPIGTAAPTLAEQKRVKHYFVGTHSITEDFNAGQYEVQAMATLEQLFPRHPIIVMTGGSMLYIDAVCKGLDNLPKVPDSVRIKLRQEYEQHGLSWLQKELRRVDPTYFDIVDPHNPQRLLHALEITCVSGVPYSSLRTGATKKRPFKILKIGLNRDRESLYERINQRVETMMINGLEEEARLVYPQRQYNSLNTVGYKELFAYFDGKYTKETAIDLIKQNSRHYAKRQLTWFRKDADIHWFDVQAITINNILSLL